MFAVCYFVVAVFFQFPHAHTQAVNDSVSRDTLLARDLDTDLEDKVAAEIVVAFDLSNKTQVDLITVGTKVTLKGEPVGIVTAVKSALDEKVEIEKKSLQRDDGLIDRRFVQVSIEPKRWDLLKRGTLAVMSVNLESASSEKVAYNKAGASGRVDQLQRTIELLIPFSDNAKRLNSGDIVIGYPSFSAFWMTGEV